MQTRTKTDAVDAALLAQFIQRLPFEPWQRPDAPALAIPRRCPPHRGPQQAAYQNQEPTPCRPTHRHDAGFVIASLQQMLAYLEAQIEHLRQQVRDIIAADEQL